MSYLDRAMKSQDRRYAKVLRKLGYQNRAMKSGQDSPDVPEVPKASSEEIQLAQLRADYQALTGRRPFWGWDADALRQKIAEYEE